MNAIAFGTKRAFHAFLRLTRRGFTSVGLTAARFDLLYGVNRGRVDDRDWVLQSALRRKLGVTAGVVSRMLGALEALGWIIREVPDFDRRQRVVKLTEKGRAGFKNAYQLLVRGVRRLVYEAICFGLHRDPAQRWVHTDELENYLLVLRDFGDTATLYYPLGHLED
jgi:DNA-binding MarR family transcriptional regulator